MSDMDTVAKDVWIFSKPFARGGLIPIGGRSTAVKLSNGGVWVLASTPLSTETKSTLDKMGPVEYIVSADRVHHLFLTEYKTAYPNAKVIAPADAVERHGNKDLKVDGIWGKDPPDTKYGFEDDIQHCYFSGFVNKDVAFFHPASKTLIEADLLFNLPATEQYSKSKTSGKIPVFGGFNPMAGPLLALLGRWARTESMRSLHPCLFVDSEWCEFARAMKRDAKTVSQWDFERIIPCHGDVIEQTGKKAWLDCYRHYLN
ncbi:hypothetical protein BDZ89DRAFT_1160155 [Hymenopellis radicata]|nr:hypothetical protein BDZ89DRAFT_1160155 [Hymenopellis radicata]